MRRRRVVDEPVAAAVDPDIHAVAADELDRAARDIGGEDVLFNDRHVGSDEGAAVEGRDRGLERQRLDQHGHAAGRPPAGDREADARLVQAMDRRRARSVRTLSSVTSVPSTSASRSEMVPRASSASAMLRLAQPIIRQRLLSWAIR